MKLRQITQPWQYPTDGEYLIDVKLRSRFLTLIDGIFNNWYDDWYDGYAVFNLLDPL